MSKQKQKNKNQKQRRYRRRLKTELTRLRKQSERMELKMYSVRDSKAETFHPPFYKRTHGEAERDFQSLAHDEKSQVSKFPEDYDLYWVGSYDETSGKVNGLDTPQHIVKAIQLVRSGETEVMPLKKNLS